MHAILFGFEEGEKINILDRDSALKEFVLIQPY